MSGTDRRGELVAILASLLSLAGAIILALLAFNAENASSALWGSALMLVGASGIWLITVIQLHQRRLMAEERLEVEALEQQRQEKLGGVKTIFDDEEIDQMEHLATGRRLRSIERFLVPTVSLLVAVYFIVAGVFVIPWKYQIGFLKDAAGVAIPDPMFLAIACGAAAFVCYMFARYALGMSHLRSWNLLCAGGNVSFGVSAACLAVSISLLCAANDILSAEVWVSRGVGALMILLGIETIINFILDIYRPRVEGQRQRPFYDSRLLGLFSEPGGMLKSLANAIDYQFGFKVSETWFYKLLGHHLPKLLLLQAAVILALTCILVVPPGHQAVVEHFGERPEHTKPPGLHFKWCWPIDCATIIPVERIQRMELGYEIAEKKEDRYTGPILWTKKHYKKEYLLLIADKTASKDTKVPVNLVSLGMPIQWRVKLDEKEVIRYHAQSADVGEIVKSLAYRELTQYSAHADLHDLIGKGGIETAEILHNRIQEACDNAGLDSGGLGVKIVYVSIGVIHPPARDGVGEAYEKVVSEMEKKEAKIMAAEGDAAMIKIISAGLSWDRIYQAIVAEDIARRGDSPDLLQRSTEEVERLLREESGGLARVVVSSAVRKTVARVFNEKSAAERYQMQLVAYEAAPHVYLLQDYLRLLRDGLKDVEKYIVVLDDPDKVIYNMDFKPPSGLDTLSAEAGIR